jgi:large subunit ribosomal protein L15
MELHQLQPKTKNKGKKRIGRGGKRGTTSGRGQKGQSSRAGHKKRPAERDIILKLPKFRSQKKPALKKAEKRIINISDLERKTDGIVNKKVLFEAKLINSLDAKVKILGKGRIVKKFQIEGIEVSKKLKEKIEKSGGKVIN